MQHSIKVNRALNFTKFPPAPAAEILTSIPPELISQLSGRELAAVMSCLDVHWHKAVRYRDRQILDDGCIFDNRANKLRDLAAETWRQS